MIEYLRVNLQRFIGARVMRCGLLIWPDRNGRAETDTRIHFELLTKKGQTFEITLGTAPDGQTPVVDDESWVTDYLLDQLPERIKKWSKPDFWSKKSFYKYELFDVSGSKEFAGVVGSKISHIRILCFDDEYLDPTGLVVVCSEAGEIWSVPGITGNAVFRRLPENWLVYPYKEILIS